MAAAIKEEFNLDTELIADGGGVFYVYANGEKIYDNKIQCGKFPEHSEIIESIEKLRT